MIDTFAAYNRKTRSNPTRHDSTASRVVVLLTLTMLLTITHLHPISANADNVEAGFQEMEPDDQENQSGSFGQFSTRSQDQDVGPGDTENGGDFGNINSSTDEIEPADLERTGDFGDPSIPNKTLNNTF